jgi:cytochrome c-type protein NapB
MEKPKPAKYFFLFAGVCVIAIPFIIFSALSIGSQERAAQEMGAQSMVSQAQNLDFDNKGALIFAVHDDTTGVYMEGSSTARTLNYYYSLRQYPGSPPYIVHDLADEKGAPYECLSCHARGGFTQSMNRFSPVTPHPEQTQCRQCHVKPITDQLFKATDWESIMPPRLGRSALPGSPPPIAHDIQMRENCIACHVGPGAVAVIRVEHPMRGNCRQCHLPVLAKTIFQRTPKPDQHKSGQ